MKRCLAVAFAVLVSACANGLSPSGPSPAANPAPVTPAVPTPAPALPGDSAVLVVAGFTVAGATNGDRFNFRPSLRLAETGGHTGVLVTDLEFRLDGTGPEGRLPVWRVRKRIEAGQSADLISADIYGEHEFEITSKSDVDSVSVTITFVDDAGHGGTLNAQAQVSR